MVPTSRLVQEVFMIYELALVAKPEATDQEVATLKGMVHEVVKAHDGEVFIEDEWGKMSFAQPTTEGIGNGHFVYFIFKANSSNNKELIRRLKINDLHLRHMFIALGEDEEREAVVKAYKTPFSKTYKGSVTDKEGDDDNDNPKKFASQKSCYFKSNNLKANWKDPATFTWLINEFGKISAARVTGVSRKHQRFATTAIKRARQIGVASYVSNRIADLRA
jgi:small subunit ribosomal protein S6